MEFWNGVIAWNGVKHWSGLVTTFWGRVAALYTTSAWQKCIARCMCTLTFSHAEVIEDFKPDVMSHVAAL